MGPSFEAFFFFNENASAAENTHCINDLQMVVCDISSTPNQTEENVHAVYLVQFTSLTLIHVLTAC